MDMDPMAAASQRIELDRRMKVFEEAVKAGVPAGGWLRPVRRSLRMTLAQLGNRLGRTAATVREIEERELSGSITLHKLGEVGWAMGLEFVYGFHPMGGSLDEIVWERAYRKAGPIIRGSVPPLVIELHRMGGSRLNGLIHKKAGQLFDEMPRDFWDEPPGERRRRSRSWRKRHRRKRPGRE